MGDGIKENKSDIKKAFDNIKRIHQDSNQEIEVAVPAGVVKYRILSITK